MSALEPALEPLDRDGPPKATPLARVRAWLGDDPDFLRLWGGLTISLVGMQVSRVALPLTAIGLGATPWQMGLLGALPWVPYLLFGLVAGALLDRVRRRPILIVTHLGRAALLGLVPIAQLLGLLRIEQLFVTAFLVGTLMVLSDGAYQSLMPSLVPRERLVQGNSRFSLSGSVATIGGPSIGGALVQIITAPLAVALDAVAFAVDAALVAAIRRPEPARPRSARAPMRSEIAEGLRWVFGNPLLRPMQLTSMSFIAANGVWSSIYVLALSRQLALGPATIGLILAAGGPGALIGSLLAGRIAERVGNGPTIVGSQWAAGLATLAIPLGMLAPAGVAVPIIMAGGFAFAVVIASGSICELSLRQAITPERLQGRTNATMRSLNWGMVTIGSTAGGLLGEQIGLSATMAVGAVLAVAAALPVTLSSVWRVRALPEV